MKRPIRIDVKIESIIEDTKGGFGIGGFGWVDGEVRTGDWNICTVAALENQTCVHRDKQCVRQDGKGFTSNNHRLCFKLKKAIKSKGVSITVTKGSVNRLTSLRCYPETVYLSMIQCVVHTIQVR